MRNFFNLFPFKRSQAVHNFFNLTKYLFSNIKIYVLHSMLLNYEFKHILSYLTTLLFLFSAALCDSHFNFQMAWVCLQMRAALVTTVYRKTLSVSSTLLSAKFSIGEIVNFMSTDTDRIVNSCPSFHALWSIPFQVNG